jgi:hypothetical protein
VLAIAPADALSYYFQYLLSRIHFSHYAEVSLSEVSQPGVMHRLMNKKCTPQRCTRGMEIICAVCLPQYFNLPLLKESVCVFVPLQ